MTGENSRSELTMSPSRASTDHGDRERDPTAPGNEDVDTDPKKERSGDTVRNVRQKLVHVAHSDNEVTSTQPLLEPVPGPPKTTVVVRDVAYSTYLAFLYYVRGA